MQGLLDASPLIIARLHDKIAEDIVPGINIRPAPSSLWVGANGLSPSINVIYYDDLPEQADGGRSARGRSQTSEQLWLVVCSVQNVADAGPAAMRDAGILALEVIKAIQGWAPSAEHPPLMRKKPPYPATQVGGFFHLPLMFSTKIITEGLADG